jgi:hypothetical protein
MMHREGWKGRKATSAMAFAWIIWDAKHKGPTMLSRISWEAAEAGAALLGNKRKHQRGRKTLEQQMSEASS